MTKVYIAGPMTGKPQWNFPAFFKAEETLTKLGYEVVNPAHNDGKTVEEAMESAGDPSAPKHTWNYYLKRDLPNLMGCDVVCLLPDWQTSKGANLEVTVANALGMPLMIIRDGRLVPRVEAIGIAGYARSGKDTAAEWVAKWGYQRTSFADPMREALLKMNPIVDPANPFSVRLKEQVDEKGWDEVKASEFGPEVRVLLQKLGTEVGREMFGGDFWVELALKRIPDGAKVVIPDVRFKNEAEAIKRLGGQVWRITREGVGPANDHISEHDLDDYDFDYIMENDGTIGDLRAMVSHVMEKGSAL